MILNCHYTDYNGRRYPACVGYRNSCTGFCTGFTLKTMRCYTRSFVQVMMQTMYQPIYHTMCKTICEPIPFFARVSALDLTHFEATKTNKKI